MSQFSRNLQRPLLVALFTYLLGVGATFNGVLLPDIQRVTLVVMAVLVGWWLFIRWQQNWSWHGTVLDYPVLLWILAIFISLVANQEVWRRIVIGVWYVGLYIGVWYILHDAIANRAITREKVIDGLLIASLIIIVFGYLQSAFWLRDQLPLFQAGLIGFELPRPGSLIGNPNALGGLLLMLPPLAAGRYLSIQRRFEHLMLVAYIILVIGLLFLTFSRGAWIGAIVGAAAFLTLLLAHRNLLSFAALRRWWRRQRRRVRVISIALSSLFLIGVAGVAFVLLRSLTLSGRGVGLRIGIYDAAVELISENTLVGSGLFTFGRGLAKIQSIPPQTPHSHAHSIPLNVGVELGLVGLIVFGLTIVLVVRGLWHNWQQTSGASRYVFIGGSAAVIGFGTHHLIDLPAMMPVIALIGVVVLGLASAPVNLNPVIGWRAPLQFGLLAMGWLALLIFGFRDHLNYSDYLAVMQFGADTGNYAEAAERLHGVIEDDSSLAIYHFEQGMLYGLAVHEGDLQFLQQAIDSFERFVALEPDYVVGRANLAALYREAGRDSAALAMMQEVVLDAPEAWSLAYQLGRYAEVTGDSLSAESAYRQMLDERPDAILLPEWGQMPVPSRFTDIEVSLSLAAQVVRLLEAGQTAAAQSLWRDSTDSRLNRSDRYAIDAILALAAGDRNGAVTALDNLALLVEGTDVAWLHVGRARLANFDGDVATELNEIEQARTALLIDLLESDFPTGDNLVFLQFLRLGISRQLLPQVGYMTTDPILLHLLENHE